MAVTIPPDMLPLIDWHAKDKLAAYNFFKKRTKLYFNIGYVEDDIEFDNIFFFCNK